MTTQQGEREDLPEVHLDQDAPKCGKFVCKDGEQDVLCDLPEGHGDSVPCSASLDHHTV